MTDAPLPGGWFDLLGESLPLSQCETIRAAVGQGEPLRALRLHKIGEAAFFSWLNEAHRDSPPFAPVPWARGGFMLPTQTAISFGKHPLHAAGAYYLQEPSAMAPATALDVHPGHRVLDLCAAPGGKSSQIAAALSGEGVLVANEPHPSRARELRGNLTRLGVTNAIVTQETPERLAERFTGWFDRVLIDAPCSGEGMFRRSAAARRDWSLRAVKGCAARQRAILESAQSALRPGGLMVYSTCTFNHIENEMVTRSFIDSHPDFTLEDFILPGLPPSESGMLHITPDLGLGEGQFMARLRKSAAGKDHGAIPSKTRTRRKGERYPSTYRHPLSSAESDAFEAFRSAVVPGFMPQGSMFRLGGHITATPPSHPEPARWADLRVLAAGIDLGAPQPYGWEPSCALAMAIAPEQARRVVALDDAQAALWIGGSDVWSDDLFNGAGWGLAVYNGLSLGFGKVSDGRFKNKTF